MSGIDASWLPAVGMEPPPPQMPDSYRIYVRYQGAWNDSLTCDMQDTSKRFDNLPPGEYTIFVYGVYEGELSQAYASETITLPGSPVTPTSGSGPPSGNSDIAAPDSLTLNEAA